MCWDDFKRMFCEVSIVRDDDSYAFNSVAVPTLEVGRVFGVELTVRQDSNVTVEVHQPSKRAYAKEALTFQYGGVALQAWRCRGVLSCLACGLCVHGSVYGSVDGGVYGGLVVRSGLAVEREGRRGWEGAMARV